MGHVLWAAEVAGDVVAAVSVTAHDGCADVSGEEGGCLFPTADVLVSECADGWCVAEVVQGVADFGE